MKKQTSYNLSTICIVIISAILIICIVGAVMLVNQKTEAISLKKEWENKVTELEKTLSENQKKSDSQGFHFVGKGCTAVECLFSYNYLMGVATIKGYYSPIERTAWDETKTCDGFTITEGPQELVKAMSYAVDEGNTVHSKNDLSQPVINLGLNLLSSSEMQAIKNSNVTKQIELIVMKEMPTESGVPVCYQDVIVLRKK